MQIMSYSIATCRYLVRVCVSSRFMRAFYTTFDMKCLGPAIQTDGSDVQKNVGPVRLAPIAIALFCWIMSIFYTVHSMYGRRRWKQQSQSHSFQTCVSKATKALNPWLHSDLRTARHGRIGFARSNLSPLSVAPDETSHGVPEQWALDVPGDRGYGLQSNQVLSPRTKFC